MSKGWAPGLAAVAVDAPQFTAWRDAAPARFTPWGGAPAVETANDPDPEPAEVPLTAADIEAIRAEAYEEAFAAARAALEAEMAPERASLIALASSLKALKPEPSGPLALLLVEVVDSLVRQVVGEVGIDPALLLSRAQAAAALIADETRPALLKLNPRDHARLADAALPVPSVADAEVRPGCVVLETGEGWVEDGVEARLDAVRAALGQIGARG